MTWMRPSSVVAAPQPGTAAFTDAAGSSIAVGAAIGRPPAIAAALTASALDQISNTMEHSLSRDNLGLACSFTLTLLLTAVLR